MWHTVQALSVERVTARGTGIVVYRDKDGKIRTKKGTGTVTGKGIALGHGTVAGRGKAAGKGKAAGHGKAKRHPRLAGAKRKFKHRRK